MGTCDQLAKRLRDLADEADDLYRAGIQRERDKRLAETDPELAAEVTGG